MAVTTLANRHFKLKMWSVVSPDTSGIMLVKNQGGAMLGYSAKSWVEILTVDGLAFKDLNKNGLLDKYEDWRLPIDIRAKDLASKLSINQIASLMLYSGHQAILLMPSPMEKICYNGKPFNPNYAIDFSIA